MLRTHTIRGRRWRIEGLRNVRRSALGECRVEDRVLRVPLAGDTLAELDTIIHEALHAATELDETAVSETAEAVARLLWRLGWRNEEGLICRSRSRNRLS